MLTYGDMVTLLLCFFVLLFSMATLNKPKIIRTMQHFQQQFGVLPKFKTTFQIFQQPQQMTQTESFVLRRGPPGDSPAVTFIAEDERTKIVIGGKDLFRPGTAELVPEGVRRLKEDVAPRLKGFRHRIEVRGHTASNTPGSFEDLWRLGYERAYSVMRLLVDEAGIDRERFRLVSCADTDPRADNASEEGRKRNRRVEIIMTEDLVTGTENVGIE